MKSPPEPAAILRDGAIAPPQDEDSQPSPPDDDADHVRRRQVFLLDSSPCRSAVFRRQQAALFGEDHPAIAPPVRQHALVVDEVVALPGGEDACVRLVERIEPGMVGGENSSSLKSSVV